MILTGRAVGADEALAMGLANRVVDDGQALRSSAAQALARRSPAFRSAACAPTVRSAWRSGTCRWTQALQREGARRLAAVQAEGLAGAARFAAGAGRHGAHDALAHGVDRGAALAAHEEHRAGLELHLRHTRVQPLVGLFAQRAEAARRAHRTTRAGLGLRQQWRSVEHDDIASHDLCRPGP
jgi:hypothetical protein